MCCRAVRARPRRCCLSAEEPCTWYNVAKGIGSPGLAVPGGLRSRNQRKTRLINYRWRSPAAVWSSRKASVGDPSKRRYWRDSCEAGPFQSRRLAPTELPFRRALHPSAHSSDSTNCPHNRPIRRDSRRCACCSVDVTAIVSLELKKWRS